MTVNDFYKETSYALQGLDSDWPVHGDENAIYWLSVLNYKKDELYNDLTKNWYPCFSLSARNEPGTVSTVGTTALTGVGTHFTDYRSGDRLEVDGETSRTIDIITSDTSLTVTVAFTNTDSALAFIHYSIVATGIQSYNLHRSFLAPSQNGGVVTTTSVIPLETITHNKIDIYNQQVFVSGINPMVLNFSAEIKSTDAMVGGVLAIPGYYMPADLVNTTDELPFLDPNWAVMAVASEIAFNDITYESKAPDLNAKANSLYTQMVKTNRTLTPDQPKTVPYIVNRITRL